MISLLITCTKLNNSFNYLYWKFHWENIFSVIKIIDLVSLFSSIIIVIAATCWNLNNSVKVQSFIAQIEYSWDKSYFPDNQSKNYRNKRWWDIMIWIGNTRHDTCEKREENYEKQYERQRCSKKIEYIQKCITRATLALCVTASF